MIYSDRLVQSTDKQMQYKTKQNLLGERHMCMYELNEQM